MTDRMAAVRAARTQAKDFTEYKCPECGTKHRVLSTLNADVWCSGNPERPHRSQKLKAGTDE